MISNFLKNPDRRFVWSLEYSILFLVVFYFVVLFFSEYETLGLESPIIEIPQHLKQINEIVLYVMLSLLAFELVEIHEGKELESIPEKILVGCYHGDSDSSILRS